MVSPRVAEHIFWACAVLSNMLGVHDGLDTLGAHEADFKPASPDLPELVPENHVLPGAVNHVARSKRLRTHFHVAANAEEVMWVKTRNEIQEEGPDQRMLSTCTAQRRCLACTV